MSNALLGEIAEGLCAGKLVPYLGPEVLEIDGPAPVPTSSRGLVERLTAKVGVPGRIRNNLWSAAQYIETNKHRQTLVRLMQEIFAPPVAPNVLHQSLASLNLPLIVSAWYDATMAAALAERTDWGQAQGVTRNGEYEDIWFRFFRPDGTETKAAEAESWATLLYAPHGAVKPQPTMLVSDSDYVEVLTEIDIQTPIPEIVQERRASRGFVFLGCRFYDQMERSFARQVMKRSAGPHYAVLPGDLTKNEAKFLEQQEITRIDVSLTGAAKLLAREVAQAQLPA